jgi:hypothetical protein
MLSTAFRRLDRPIPKKAPKKEVLTEGKEEEKIHIILEGFRWKNPITLFGPRKGLPNWIYDKWYAWQDLNLRPPV